MQRIFLTVATATAFTIAAAAALAADMPRPAYKAPPPAPAYFSWTGFYLGVNFGGGWAHEPHELFNGIPGNSEGGFTHDPRGVIGGGQIGYNWQFAPWFGWGTGAVLGVEADFQGSSQTSTVNGAFTDPIFGPVTFSGGAEDRLKWFGTVRGRAGIAFDRVLVYGTGGWAFGNVTLDGTLASSNAGGPLTATAFNTSNTMNGWTAGGGIEWAFLDHWSAKLEYLYIDFGRRDDVAIPAGPFIITNGHFIDNVARAGVNYKF
ncbi:MAG TPA: outer membrane beta-barrel protein [Pseudolabrys sp.]|nr:outer membrane beta-barrel protein [Pseudolabrys sp.]